MKGKKKWLILAAVTLGTVAETLASQGVLPPVVGPFVALLAQALAGLPLVGT